LAAAAVGFPFVMTLAIMWVTDHTVGLRVTAEEQVQGLDMGEHAEAAYVWPWNDVANDLRAGAEPQVLTPDSNH